MFMQMTVVEELESLKKAIAIQNENHSEMWQMYNRRNDQYWDKHHLTEILKAAILEIRDHMSESEGIAGYHKNGDVASWDSLNLPCFKAAIAELEK